ncbi:AbrB/MazE/SpoVT family DNA-binding domain-containing protein [Sphingomonas sp. Leaf343]|uniref:AbrB/MazE/SpoVT family DNA-binding domain-containing protein n=1 Tax=Sphingomonas sp. Leaf343 TaxID=1736345 RepID=UPI0006F93C03|nr:AbrB/MazE/SpoVT family DNA-binding domain-containing protein [Sphingomonas sp. Leaf343]KQR87662.1 hypothetical protein ASG07_01860 [Sphingomonas sp. Leaf343]
MNAQTTISGKGQVVIPKDVRDRLHLSPGDRLDVIERPDGVLLRRRAAGPKEPFDVVTARIRARVQYDGPPVPLDDMKASVTKMWADSGPDWDR